MSNIRKIAIVTPFYAWGILGFKRGIDSYNYNFKNDKLYRNSEKPQKLYIHKTGWGVIGTLIYINPFSFFYFVYKELYRLEVNLRGLEDEKKEDFYNELV